METKNEQGKKRAPGFISALAAGFNHAASHLWLLVFPLAYDLLYWLGPRLSIYDLTIDDFNAMVAQMQAAAPASMSAQLPQMFETLQFALENLNLLSLLQTIPFSVPSLLAGAVPNISPLGTPKIIEVSSYPQLGLVSIILLVIGFLLGCVYFKVVTRSTVQDDTKQSESKGIPVILNLVLMSLALLVVVGLALIPFSCVYSMLAMLSPGFATIISFLAILILAWFILPLFFTPFAITISKLSLTDAVKQSVKIGRYNAQSTSMMIASIVVIWQGLNLVWTIPAADSWMLLIGVLGHAFIAAGLLSAVSILYQNNLKWITENPDAIRKRNPFITIKVVRSKEEMEALKKQNNRSESDVVEGKESDLEIREEPQDQNDADNNEMEK